MAWSQNRGSVAIHPAMTKSTPGLELKIQIHKEPNGLEGIELCYFCKTPTRYWTNSNTPVCPTCAVTHNPDELPKARHQR